MIDTLIERGKMEKERERERETRHHTPAPQSGVLPAATVFVRNWSGPLEYATVFAACWTFQYLLSGLTFPISSALCTTGGWPLVFYVTGDPE